MKHDNEYKNLVQEIVYVKDIPLIKLNILNSTGVLAK